MEAAGRNQVGTLWLLLAHKANADARDKNGQTPLSLAVEGGFAEGVELLIATDGADPNA